MKRSITSILIALLLISISCTSQKNSSGKNLSVDYKIQSSYLLIPVEEKAPEIKISVLASNPTHQYAFDVHLAVDKIDYWVPLDVKELKDQNLTLSFLGVNESILGIKEIKQSNEFEFEYNEKYRPQFHFSPEYGWMNDPNGMVYLDGEYHLFYQYNPYGSMWGNMHWGHAVSTDLNSWTYLPTAIAPDSLGAIFSGSAVIDVNNTAGFGKNAMVAIYTSAGRVQSQSIAYSTDKGRTFTKYEGNPVIPNPGIPDFRDPKVFWHNESNQWIMSLATKQTITFYGSANLKSWTRLSEFGDGIGSHGGVWECPDLVPLDYNGKTKWVLVVSINPGGPNGGSATQYFIGDFDGKTFRADALPYPLWMDYGRDNYAGVTWSNIPENDGRKIFMGWMSNWDYANNVPTKNFRSAMTVARELKMANNGKHLVVSNYPVSETKTLRALESAKKDVVVEKEVVFSNLLDKNKGTYEIEMTLKPQNAGIFGFMLQNSKNEELEFRFDMTTGFFSIHRHKSGLVDFEGRFAAGMNAPLVKKDAYKVRVLVDKASAEIFINEGELALTTIFFPTEVMNKLKFYTKEGKFSAEHIKIYQIK
ncbi:MAG: GH32 C-terminal domain-containing protein [Paludibacter sp.]|jgi:fructan beta-fructosidase|nr:GH32 C-terminal domain-containing protein [Paludibacter sp.]